VLIDRPTLRTVEISAYAAIAQCHSQTASGEAQETGRRLTVAPRRAAPERCRPGDCPRAGGLRRTHHGQHGARNHAEASGVRPEPAIAVSSSLKRNLSSQGFTLMARCLCTTVSLSLHLMPMLTRAPPTRVIRSSACCEGSDCRTFAWLFVQPFRATATPCKPMSEGFLRSRVTIGSWVPQTNFRRRNWRAHWPLMVVTLSRCSWPRR
jgi:hypothetical protein